MMKHFFETRNKALFATHQNYLGIWKKIFK